MGTVAKALKLLDLFEDSRPAIGLSEFARLSGLNKATAYRLLSELSDAGFVQQDSDNRHYRLGPAVLRLAAVREKTTPNLTAARPVVEALAKETGETAHLSLLDGDAMLTSMFVLGRAHSTRVYLEEGERIPLHATASGLVTLAYAPADLAQEALNRPLPRFTETTATKSGAVRKMVDAARRAGFGEVIGGYEAGVHGIAAPLFDADAASVGAVAVATPTSRISDASTRRIKAALASAASEITWRWGGATPPDLAETWTRLAR